MARPFRVAIIGTGHNENSLGWQLAYNQIYDLMKDPDMPLLVSLDLVNRTRTHAESLRARIIDKFKQDKVTSDVRQSIDDLVKISDIETIKNNHCLEDLAIITIDAAKYKQRGPHTRLSDIQYNLKPVTDVAEQFKGYKGKVIVVTNPVDILAYVFAAYSSISLDRILAFHPETYRYVSFLEEVCNTIPPYGYCATSLVELEKSVEPQVEGFVIGNHEGEYKDTKGRLECECLGILSQTKIGQWLIYALPEDVQLKSITAIREIELYVNKKMFAKEGESADGSEAVKNAIAKGFAPMLRSLIKSIVVKNKYVMSQGTLFKFSDVKCSEEKGYKDSEYLDFIEKDPISISGYPFVSTPSGFRIVCDDARFNLSYEKKEFQTFLRYFKNSHERIEALFRGELRDKDGALMVHKWWEGNKEKTNNIPLKIDKKIVKTGPTQFQSVGGIIVSGKKIDFNPETVLFAASEEYIIGYCLNHPETPFLEKKFKEEIYCIRHNVVEDKEKLFLGIRGKILMLNYPDCMLEHVYELPSDSKNSKVYDVDFTSSGIVAACCDAGLIGFDYGSPKLPRIYEGTQGLIKSVKVAREGSLEKILAAGKTIYMVTALNYDDCFSFKGVDDSELRGVALGIVDGILNVYGAGSKYMYRWQINKRTSKPVKSRTCVGSAGVMLDFFKRDQSPYLLLGHQRPYDDVVILDGRTLEPAYDLLPEDQDTGKIGFLKVFNSNAFNWLAIGYHDKGSQSTISQGIKIRGLDLDTDMVLSGNKLKGVNYLCIAHTTTR